MLFQAEYAEVVTSKAAITFSLGSAVELYELGVKLVSECER